MNYIQTILLLLFFTNLGKGDQLSRALLERTQNLIGGVEIPVEISNEMLVLRITEKDHEGKCDLIYNFDYFGFQYHYKLPEAVIPKEFHDSFYAEKKLKLEEEKEQSPKKKMKKQKPVPSYMQKTQNLINHGAKPKIERKKVVENEKMKRVPGAVEEKSDHHHQRDNDQESEDEIEIKKREYGNFLNSAVFIIEFLFVDLNTYKNFSHLALGDRRTRTVTAEGPNVNAWFYSQNQEEDDYLYMRFKVSKIYQVSGFPGKRMGFCNYDLDTLKNYDLIKDEYSVMDKQRGPKKMKGGMINPFDKNTNPFKLTYKKNLTKMNYNLISSAKGNFSIIEVIAKECEQKPITSLKKEFIYRINMLLLSKSVLEMDNIGRYNKSDDCYYDNMFKKNIALSKVDNFNNYRCQVVQYLRKLVTFDMKNVSRFYKPNFERVVNTCKVIRDKIIRWDYLGERRSDLDFTTKNKKVITNFTFKAFEGEKFTSYLVSYPNENLFLSTDIFEEANTYLPVKDAACFYHSDTYFTGKDFGEIYFVTFIIPKNLKKKILL